jgi:molybdopterin molybdotransferase
MSLTHCTTSFSNFCRLILTFDSISSHRPVRSTESSFNHFLTRRISPIAQPAIKVQNREGIGYGYFSRDVIMTELLNVDKAREQILANIHQLPDETAPLSTAFGRVLAKDIQATIDLPPFANSAMDGYAVRAEDTHGATPESPVQLAVAMDILAGFTPTKTLQPGQSARIMTGAVVPKGADAVVQVEHTDASWQMDTPPAQHVRIFHAVSTGNHVRPLGSDLAKGTTVLEAGAVLRPQDLGILAALGYAQVPVYRRPRVVILSHGDELIPPDKLLAPGKIYDSNSYTLAALIESCGAEPSCMPIVKDTPEEVRKLFQTALDQQPDMIISSGGASVGVSDLIYPILAEQGQINFWRINLSPGKPLIFGQLQNVPFFGLPGNPVSVMVTFDVLVRPALLKQVARPDDWMSTTAITGETIISDGRRTYMRVKLTVVDGQLIAHSTGTQSSSTLLSMVRADGLLIVPEGITQVQAGESLPVRLMRQPAELGWQQKISKSN